MWYNTHADIIVPLVRHCWFRGHLGSLLQGWGDSVRNHSTNESALLILHADAGFRERLAQVLQARYAILGADCSLQAASLIRSRDVRLVVADRIFPCDGLPLILVGECGADELAQGLRRGCIVRYLPDPVAIPEVANVVTEAWSGVTAFAEIACCHAERSEASPGHASDAHFGAGDSSSSTQSDNSPTLQRPWSGVTSPGLDCAARVETPDLMSVLSHDISNLASALAGVFEFILANPPDPNTDEVSDFVCMGYQSSKDLLDAIGLIVDLYRTQAGKRRLNLARIEADTLAAYALDRVEGRARDRCITLARDVQPGAIWGDVTLLKRAIISLLIRAIRTTPRGSSVLLHTSGELHGDMLGWLVRVTDGAAPLFSDTLEHPLSELLPATVADSAMRRGITLDDVGLAFCDIASRLHGGRAWVASQESVGNAFFVAIPPPGLPDVNDGSDAE